MREEPPCWVDELWTPNDLGCETVCIRRPVCSSSSNEMNETPCLGVACVPCLKWRSAPPDHLPLGRHANPEGPPPTHDRLTRQRPTASDGSWAPKTLPASGMWELDVPGSSRVNCTRVGCPNTAIWHCAMRAVRNEATVARGRGALRPCRHLFFE